MTSPVAEAEPPEEAIRRVAEWMRTKYSCPADRKLFEELADRLEELAAGDEADRRVAGRVVRSYLRATALAEVSA